MGLVGGVGGTVLHYVLIIGKKILRKEPPFERCPRFLLDPSVPTDAICARRAPIAN